MSPDLTRRGYLAVTAAAGGAALAGCSDDVTADPDAIDDADRPALGAENAPVTVTVFEDYGCPACARFKAQALPALIDQYIETGEVRYLHADFPIPVDEAWSHPVANAAREVFFEAGNDAFWLFSSSIYDHQGSYSLDAIETVAADVADDEAVGAAARAAADEEAHSERIAADRDRGESWGVGGTPAVFVDETEVDPAYDEIDSAIQDRL
ncbi:thioredoxin domain protein [Natronomonas pharaonis DSM 2160]|uniref:Thioredoxin domain protein n=1 Tax=Natronomonas pharaonis (strain ATCC 35678 / DSM 2160 / CIP 103997 / JCM 8858 / NBRC 14720 / NCIMB 2260 / Gabara) TaxID=348780 RepID=A0A1U7EW98_NATPD|nr:thioredoxin domain-containing protein [Natronomonas pharaonis]CAI49359.1 thioredoxin domain protein [Natronomonas pharaonis DSM 2160]